MGTSMPPACAARGTIARLNPNTTAVPSTRNRDIALLPSHRLALQRCGSHTRGETVSARPSGRRWDHRPTYGAHLPTATVLPMPRVIGTVMRPAAPLSTPVFGEVNDYLSRARIRVVVDPGFDYTRGLKVGLDSPRAGLGSGTAVQEILSTSWLYECFRAPSRCAARFGAAAHSHLTYIRDRPVQPEARIPSRALLPSNPVGPGYRRCRCICSS
jgi:hypothetical protein